MGRTPGLERKILSCLFYSWQKGDPLQSHGIKGSFKHLKLGETSKGIWPILSYFVNLNAACVSIGAPDSLQHSCS